MTVIKAVFKKEWQGYFNSPIAYIYLAVFWVFIGWFFYRSFFLVGQASLRLFFDILPWVFLFFVPAVSMRSWAEEKRSGTLSFLLTFPVTDFGILMGKFLASAGLLLLCLAGTWPLVVTAIYFGSPDLGAIVMGYIGAFSVGLVFLAIGFFVSSLTQNQIIAFIISIVACFFGLILSHDSVLFSVPDFLVPVFQVLGVGHHYESMARGVLDLRDLVYFVSVIGFFIYLNLWVLDSRKVSD